MYSKDKIQKALLLCGIISSLLYIATIVFAAMRWEGYSSISQMVSEFIAIDAPTSVFVVPLFVLYSFLMYLFGAGVWRSADQNRVFRFAAVGLIGKEILGLVVTLFFPIHLRGVTTTNSDVMHGVLTMIGNLFMLLAIVSAAIAFGKRFRIYSVITMLMLIVFGILTGLYIPNIEPNLPTPWMGLFERINIVSYMIWVALFAAKLLRLRKDT